MEEIYLELGSNLARNEGPKHYFLLHEQYRHWTQAHGGQICYPVAV